MTGKKYYSERKGLVQPKPINFQALKRIFLHVFRNLDKDFLFREATGYTCVDNGKTDGIWGDDAEAHFYLETGLDGAWPISEYIDEYDEATLFTIVEFLHDYVSDPQFRGEHTWHDCGWHTGDYDKKKGQEKYRREMNTLLGKYDIGYRLTEDGEVQRIPPTGLETLTEKTVKTDDPENIATRIQHAISKYLRHGVTLADQKEAIRTLGDVLEFLRKEGIKLPEKDDNDLFNIINRFDIRHHNKFQQRGYDKEIWFDWMFYTFLASINVLLRTSKKS